jgi:hypothetical protein
MKAPCIVLDGADASGEFLRLLAQHEYPFWREVWLSPEAGVVTDTAPAEVRRSG